MRSNYLFSYRLGSNGIRPVVQNTALLNVLESHMTKLSIPQYTKEDVTQVNTIIFHNSCFIF